MEYVAAGALGFLGGMLGGLVGVGGGVLFVPALVIFLDQAQVRAESSSLLAIVFVALLGAYRQYGYGNVQLREGVVAGTRAGDRGAARAPSADPRVADAYRPCSSAPFTDASSALSRYSASASGESKPRPDAPAPRAGPASGP